MRIVFLGSGEFAVPTLQWLASSENEVPLVITQPARPRGRGRRETPTPVATFGRQAGLDVLETADVNEAAVVRRVQAVDPRLGLVIAFGQKLKAGLLAGIPGGFVNLHASLLPKYRGAAPINWAIMWGELSTGCSVFRIVEQMDAGPILAQRETPIRPDETAGELHDRLAGLGVEAVRAALALFRDDVVPLGDPQEDALATRAPKLRKTDGFVRFDRLMRDVVNQVHGVTPWPGASAIYRNRSLVEEPVLLTRMRACATPGAPKMAPGTIDERLMVATSDGFVEVLELRPSSGRTMIWRDFVNGRHVQAGDILRTPELP